MLVASVVTSSVSALQQFGAQQLVAATSAVSAMVFLAMPA
jgi:hypothetical protein